MIVIKAERGGAKVEGEYLEDAIHKSAGDLVGRAGSANCGKSTTYEGQRRQTKYRNLPPGMGGEVSAKGNAAECTDAAHALCKRREIDGREMSMSFHATISRNEKRKEKKRKGKKRKENDD